MLRFPYLSSPSPCRAIARSKSCLLVSESQVLPSHSPRWEPLQEFLAAVGNFASGAIKMAQRRLVICGCMLVCLLLACQEVLGIELRHSKEDVELDPNFSPVDGKNLYRTEDGTLIELLPEPEAHLQFANSTRRKLGEFLGCAFCKCCDAAKTFCKAGLPCCYSINCNVQPFGFCKFVPIACNCKECGI